MVSLAAEVSLKSRRAIHSGTPDGQVQVVAGTE